MMQNLPMSPVSHFPTTCYRNEYTLTQKLLVSPRTSLGRTTWTKKLDMVMNKIQVVESLKCSVREYNSPLHLNGEVSRASSTSTRATTSIVPSVKQGRYRREKSWIQNEKSSECDVLTGHSGLWLCGRPPKAAE